MMLVNLGILDKSKARILEEIQADENDTSANGNYIKVGNMFVEPEATTKHVQEPFCRKHCKRKHC